MTSEPQAQKTVAQITKENEEQDVERAGYRQSDYLWFGDSHPPHAVARCMMCDYQMPQDLESLMKYGIGEVCPECKRRSLKYYDGEKWVDYLNLRLWEFDLFLDQFKMQYAAYNNNNNSRHITHLKSEEIRGLLALRVKNKAAIENSIARMSGLCFRAGKTHELHTRIARKGGAVWIDMCDEKWRAIKITPNEGWKIEEHPPILFRRYDHMKPFYAEEGTKKDLDDFFKLINFGGENKAQQKLLYAGYLATQFLPDIQTALLMPVGPPGSAKSTISNLTRSVIDPSSAKEIVLTQRTELPQTFMQHRLPVFGNCGYLSQEQSDMFCNLITGGSIFKRKLFTDSDAVVWTFTHSTILNGIVPPSLAPDLMTRTLKFELETIPSAFLRTETDVMNDADEVLPRLRGYFIQLVADSMAEPLPPSNEITRLGDFGRWGDFLTSKIGWGQGEFLSAIIKTGQEGAREAVGADYVGGILLAMLDEKGDFEGTTSDLMGDLVAFGMDPKNPNAPKTTSRLSDTIYGKLKNGMALFGWNVGRKITNGRRLIIITKGLEMKTSS